jgi:LacI family transcriptional regulator
MRITLNDVAKRAGVSRNTVSLVVNGKYDKVKEETRKRVEDAIQEMGYVPDFAARQLTGKRTKTLGVILPPLRNAFSFYNMSEMSSGISDAAGAQGYNLMFFVCNERFKQGLNIRLLKDSRIDGGLILDNGRLVIHNIEELERDEIPFVILNYRLERPKTNYVAIDKEHGSYLAVKHLIDLGHRRIGFINGSLPQHIEERFYGYRRALDEAGIKLDPECVVTVTEGWVEKTGYEAADMLLELPQPPTSIVTASDLIAIGVYKRLKEKGLRVPEDISVIGYDDIPIARYQAPSLTTIRQPYYDLGVKAVDILMGFIKNRDQRSVHESIKPILVNRDSCAPTSR